MVLNLITLKIRPFLPGLGWKKKGFPWLETLSKMNVIINTGDSIIKAINAKIKSSIGFKSDLYI
jgi:hypothetical protein